LDPLERLIDQPILKEVIEICDHLELRIDEQLAPLQRCGKRVIKERLQFANPIDRRLGMKA
jgi:hypothetical protein